MRILLFNPWITDFSAFDLWTRPLNLLRFASSLRRHGVEVQLFDCLDRHSPLAAGLKTHNHRMSVFGCGHYYQEEIQPPPLLSFVPRRYKRFGIPKDRVEAYLTTLAPPDCIVVASMMTYWYPGVFEAIVLLRRLFPGVPILLGGIYATLCGDHAREHAGADLVLTGAHWPAITARLLEFLTGRREEAQGDHRQWIEPAYDLLGKTSSYPMLTSVGCPFQCTYCATHAIWPAYHAYETEAVLDSMERLVREYGAEDIAFFDDALLMHKKTHFLPLLEGIVRRGWRIRLHTPNAIHVRQVDEETADLMKRAGFRTIRLALETTRPDWQEETGGKVFNAEYVSALNALRQAGFTANELGTYILYGLPGETMTMVREACELVVAMGSEIKVAMYSPVPGTRMYEAGEYDFLFDPRRDPLLQNNSLTPWRSGEIAYTDYQKFKRLVADLNQSLRSAAISLPK